ncbi:hypothetical protein Poli38472_014212 [Pythium oligandrum]|uniref:Uncharacterized protein n=1 Tax=Pythium oligandrum TaxID=41045 RepID=A0A8K1FHN8_PYTOL|nr:hypothetical protein Poli38472_014212 [Pythium oligandrum]|eukprot:TMW64095.1 hypothetical protein Poli38472_014212 [Pythium oligandrum]
MALRKTTAATSESDSETTSSTTEDTEPQTKKYRSTYYSRKSEISTLQQELKTLSERLAELQPQQYLVHRAALQDACTENAVLQQDLHVSDLVLARMQAIWSNETATRMRNPLETYIRLAGDAQQRRATLHALHAPVLDRALRFILERTRDMRLNQSQRQTHTVDATNGDHLLVQFDVTPFPNITNTRHVFDKIQFTVAHQEFQFWEHLNATAVCDSDGMENELASHARFLIATPFGVEIEQNVARFWRFAESSEHLSEPHGIYVIEFIDDDPTYSFQPDRRVRIDISCVILCRPYRYISADGTLEEGVSIVRWTFSRLHRIQCELAPQVKQDLVDMFPRWGEVFRQSIRRYMAKE